MRKTQDKLRWFESRTLWLSGYLVPTWCEVVPKSCMGVSYGLAITTLIYPGSLVACHVDGILMECGDIKRYTFATLAKSKDLVERLGENSVPVIVLGLLY